MRGRSAPFVQLHSPPTSDDGDFFRRIVLATNSKDPVRFAAPSLSRLTGIAHFISTYGAKTAAAPLSIGKPP